MNNEIIPIQLTANKVNKKWGHEIHLCNNDEFCGKILKFNKNSQFSMHFHVKKREVFFLLYGKIMLSWIDYTNSKKYERIFHESDVIEIPRLVNHQITALEETLIIEFSTTDYPDDSYRVMAGDSQK